jgi:hypothetical protein
VWLWIAARIVPNTRHKTAVSHSPLGHAPRLQWMNCEQEENALPEDVKAAGPAPHLAGSDDEKLLNTPCTVSVHEGFQVVGCWLKG